ncbi:MAG: sulfatase-like hydrolase/transferase [Chloroflexota bacterium]
MHPTNTLYIISDEHSRSAAGCYGHPLIKTPHLDQLAATGTRFTNAYTPSPTCVPTRASLATGRWVHQLGTWSSAEPYEGQAISWHQRLRECGHRVASIGKLHYRDSHARNGFSEEILPMHVVNGVGWIKGLLRQENTSYEAACRELAEQVGPGESSYTLYDRHITDATCEWLQARATQPEDKPWTLFVSFVCPHYPLYAPQEFFDLYSLDEIDMPFGADKSEWPTHPVMQEFYRFYNYDPHFDEERTRLARASYYALCSFLDDNIGQVIKALDESGQRNDTRIIYTSDHGDLIGNHGQWTKMCMYEDSVAIPLIMNGPDIPAGAVVDAPVSLVDSYPTMIESAGETLTNEEKQLPGDSLFDIINDQIDREVTFSEYHDGGTANGFFMIRLREWKYIYYAGGYPPQLFNLVDDPQEMTDLGEHPDYAAIREECEVALHNIIDPEAVNDQAITEQAEKLAKLGGVAAALRLTESDFGFTPPKHVGIDFGALV